MARIVVLRHAEAQSKETVPTNISRGLTSLGCQQARRIGEVLPKVHHFIPDLVVVSDAIRTAQTASLITGGFVDTLKFPELRLMGLHEYGVVNAIVETHPDAPFVELLARDAGNFWVRHATMVVNHLHDAITEKNAHQILAVGHHHYLNPIGLRLWGRDHPLFLGPLFKHAEGFMIDEGGSVTAVSLDSP